MPGCYVMQSRKRQALQNKESDPTDENWIGGVMQSQDWIDEDRTVHVRLVKGVNRAQHYMKLKMTSPEIM